MAQLTTYYYTYQYFIFKLPPASHRPELGSTKYGQPFHTDHHYIHQILCTGM